MLLLLVTLLRCGIMLDESWLDRAVEDKLGEIIDKYRAQGKDVHNVGALRTRVAADINGLRGGAGWAALRERYDPAPRNTVAWCLACDKPVNRGSVTAYLSDKGNNIFCSLECKENTARHPISWQEFKRRVKEKGSVSTHRIEFDYCEPVEGEQITITWDQIKDFGPPLLDVAAPTGAAVNADAPMDEIIWED